MILAYVLYVIGVVSKLPRGEKISAIVFLDESESERERAEVAFSKVAGTYKSPRRDFECHRLLLDDVHLETTDRIRIQN